MEESVALSAYNNFPLQYRGRARKRRKKMSNTTGQKQEIPH
jgi:hypothetical protein